MTLAQIDRLSDFELPSSHREDARRERAACTRRVRTTIDSILST